MGLGPPVCLLCLQGMRFDEVTKLWTCPRCGQKDNGPHVGHLFLLNKKQAEEVLSQYPRLMDPRPSP